MMVSFGLLAELVAGFVEVATGFGFEPSESVVCLTTLPFLITVGADDFPFPFAAPFANRSASLSSLVFARSMTTTLPGLQYPLPFVNDHAEQTHEPRRPRSNAGTARGFCARDAALTSFASGEESMTTSASCAATASVLTRNEDLCVGFCVLRFRF